MSRFTVYVFHFLEKGDVIRIPYAKWSRIRAGKDIIEEYSNKVIHIAYAYLLLENRKPVYCPRIEGIKYYFDKSGCVIADAPCYFDLLQDLEEDAGGVISLPHRKKKKEFSSKYQWKLNSQQIQTVLDFIWH